jgi:hypothetical protein
MYMQKSEWPLKSRLESGERCSLLEKGNAISTFLSQYAM